MMATGSVVQEFGWVALGAISYLLTAVAIYYAMTTVFDGVRSARRVKLALGSTRGPTTESRLAEGTAGIRTTVGRSVVALGRLMPLGEKDRQKIAVNLRRAGYRSTNALASMLGVKFACLLAGLTLSPFVVTGMIPGTLGVLVGLVSGVFVGVLLNVLPESVLGRIAANRLRRIDAGLAEAFDLLVVCLESGLTFDRALSRTVENLKTFQPQLAKELGQAVLDMSVHGRTREDALNRLADRVESQNFRDLAITVAQSERHGTPLADALRKLASSVRVETISRVQEKMARLPTLLIIPSITGLLPGIIVIIGGPALLQLTTNLGTFGGG